MTDIKCKDYVVTYDGAVGQVTFCNNDYCAVETATNTVCQHPSLLRLATELEKWKHIAEQYMGMCDNMTIGELKTTLEYTHLAHTVHSKEMYQNDYHKLEERIREVHFWFQNQKIPVSEPIFDYIQQYEMSTSGGESNPRVDEFTTVEFGYHNYESKPVAVVTYRYLRPVMVTPTDNLNKWDITLLEKVKEVNIDTMTVLRDDSNLVTGVYDITGNEINHNGQYETNAQCMRLAAYFVNAYHRKPFHTCKATVTVGGKTHVWYGKNDMNLKFITDSLVLGGGTIGTVVGKIEKL